ncbi:RNA methyltransferase TrmH family [Penicillium argentinense]|uniref:rRNA methyltransferase 1, mitochondrial n=1 Tax=Penicillium argentinense TaxID=1131581 RepID=A0A9W9EJC8_9EURO|nr:RNA methyltransferase TrmH family [Penicillium argentinense]KAJ5082805.1 RNA methyltransferase TrmH family [Penicillium argentinense]
MAWRIPRSSLFPTRQIPLLRLRTGAPIRFASLNSAIGRGIRRSQSPRQSADNDPDAGGRYHRRPRGNPQDRRTEGHDYNPRAQNTRKPSDFVKSGGKDGHDRFAQPHREKRPPRVQFDETEFIRTGNFERSTRNHQKHAQLRTKRIQDGNMREMVPPGKARSSSKSRAHRVTEGMPQRVKENVKVPDSIPYTTPASEFIYGTGAVEAALRCSRRQLYKLYLYQVAGEDLSPSKVALRKLALSKNIEIKLAFAGWDRLLDKMCSGRPHNGCVLEASPLPKLPVRGFCPVPSATEDHFRVELAPQSREEAAVNGTSDLVPIIRSSSMPGQAAERYPVSLLVDGVVDPGNMGAIIRSAYYLGVDAIVFAGKNSAPLSPVTIKASAGAAENMTLLHVTNEVDFIQRSKANGWRFYAADAPGPGATYLYRQSNTSDSGVGALPTSHSPSVLMMGSEASGLSGHIKSHADAIVSIPGARHSIELGVASDPARIDSLNVSVAAALLMEMFLRTPLAVSEMVKKGKGKEIMW